MGSAVALERSRGPRRMRRRACSCAEVLHTHMLPVTEERPCAMSAVPVCTAPHASPPTAASVAEHLCERLAALGVGHVFTLPGMQIDPLGRALAARTAPRAVVANHELAAGYMADGHARARGAPAVVWAIGGPGCANLVGAAAAALADRSPVLYVTGNLPRAASQPGAFQDGGPQGGNDVALMAAALGASGHVGSAGREGLADRIDAALTRVRAGTPAHLQLGHDEQLATIEQPAKETPHSSGLTTLASEPAPAPDASWLDGRTLLFADGDALAVADALGAACSRFALPLATTLAARGIVDEASPWCAGHVGFVPHPRTEALLAFGTPLAAERVLHIGGDARWTQRLRQRHPHVATVRPEAFAQGLRSAAHAPVAAQVEQRTAWLQALAAIDRQWPAPKPIRSRDVEAGMSHGAVIDALVRHERPDTAWVVDAGQVRRAAVARLRCRQPRSLFVAEGMAPMGWSLGAAVGVALALPQRPVVALLGDGAMRMHGIEIATAARYRLPIVYVLFDNRAYGSVLQRMASAEEATQARLPAVDWLAFARAFGVPARRADSVDGLHDALASPRAPEQPLLIVARVPAIDAEVFSQPSGIDWAQDGSANAEA
jgi:acetolactate synthase I/II/III large subunit